MTESLFPADLDVLPEPGPQTQQDAPGFFHDEVHVGVARAVMNVQGRIGVVGSEDPDSLDRQVRRPYLEAYQERVTNLGSISGAVALDLSASPVQRASVASSTTFTFSGLALEGRAVTTVLVLSATGTRSLTWPSAIWLGGELDSVSAGTTVVVLSSVDGVGVIGSSARGT